MSSAPILTDAKERLLWHRYQTLRKYGMRSPQSHFAENRHSMPLKRKFMTLGKTRLKFAVALTSLIGGLCAISSATLVGSLRHAEEQNVLHRVSGILGVLAQTKADFSDRYADWAAWDDTYEFIQDANQNYIESNLTPEALALAKLNLAVYVNRSGKIVYSTGFDLKNYKKIPIPEALRQHLLTADILLRHSHANSKLAGLILLPQGPMVVSSRPIVTSKGKGPIRGTLIFGRYLDTEEINQLIKTTRSSLTIYGLNQAQMPVGLKPVRLSLSQQSIIVRPLNEQTITAYSLVNDIYGKPALVLRVDMPREIYKQGQRSLQYLIVSLVLMGLLFGGITLRLLERLIFIWHQSKDREERYCSVVAQAAEGICLVDAGTNQFLEANKAFQNLLGYTLEEILTLKHDDAIAHSCKSIDEQIHYRLSQRHYFDSECQYRCKDGSIVDVEFSANLISYQERDAFCIVVRDISERKRAELALRESERRLAWQANHDPLTELYNRREFETQLAAAVSSAHSRSEQHVLCYLDLDQFKIVNDTCGHIAGDALLCHISTLLASKLRKTDTLARLGGDEFGILLYDCPSTTAVQIAHKLREQIHNYRFVWQDNSFSLGASIGLVEINATTPSPQSALSAADAASYVAKNKGGNRVHLYQLDDKELAAQQGQMQWVTRLGTALEQNRFRLYYQPIIPTSCPHSCLPQYYHSEVLLRLEDESGQIVSPMAFIPAAERYHLMHLIDRWVISTLFEQLAAQPQQSQQGRVFSVNLSGASLNDEQFICFVQAQFAATGIPPQIICFEITETVAITNLGQAAALMRLLKDTGCSFALDDFGSGMSSFAYLKNLPVDYLKIDGAFVREITSDPIAAAMVHSIAQVAKVMGIQTIAEFVEDEQIFTQLRQLQVDFAQGYAISPPLPLTGELDFPTTAIENAKTI